MGFEQGTVEPAEASGDLRRGADGFLRSSRRDDSVRPISARDV